MSKLLYISFLISVSALCATGQSYAPTECGTHTTKEDISRLLRNKALSHSSALRSFETTQVPLQFHLVANSDGSGRARPDRVLKGLCELNELFEPTGMQFYFTGEFKHIDNFAMNDLQFPAIPSGVRTLFNIRKVQKTINIFVVKNIESNVEGFYSPSSDIITVESDNVGTGDFVLAHELGHLLSLPHTFFGWEETDYNPDVATPTEVSTGGFSNKVEYVDREKNCEISGDFFCDTPADYVTGWSGGCDYTGGAVDPDGVLIDPDERNIMSYFLNNGCEESVFSKGQSEAMIADYVSRNELVGTNIAKQDPVSEAAELQVLTDEESVTFNDVTLSWGSAPNATSYIVEVSRVPNLIALEAHILTRETSLTLTDLQVDKKYYWRVSALNETNFCDRPRSEIGIFRTVEMASSTDDVKQNRNVKVFPNPASVASDIVLFSSYNIESANISVYNASGSLVSTSTENIKKGNNNPNGFTGLTAGLYIVSIKGKDSSESIKLVVR